MPKSCNRVGTTPTFNPMKSLFFTLALGLATLGSFAQSTALDVTNTTTAPVLVRATIVNTTTCAVSASGGAVLVAPNATITLPAGAATDDWYGLSITNVPGGGGITAYARSYNKCLTACSPPSDIFNGINAEWDPTCTAVKVF